MCWGNHLYSLSVGGFLGALILYIFIDDSIKINRRKK